MSEQNDANLSPDMRALVTVLREIRDAVQRCATALEAVAPATSIKEDEDERADGVGVRK